MSRALVLTLALLLSLTFCAVAQEHAQSAPAGEHATAESAQHGAQAEHAEGDNLGVWKWANFAILAILLGWMVGKAAPQFFRSRTEQIQKGIAEAAKVKQEAEARAAKMELRMASLQSEVEHIRAEAHASIASETERIRKETDQQIARLKANGEQEIRAMTKQAEQQLRAFSAELSVKLAEERIRARIRPDSQARLFDGFLRQLDSRTPGPEVRQ